MQKEHQSELAGRVLRQRLLDCDEVLQRFRHLAARDRQVTRVQKVAHPVVITIIGLEHRHHLHPHKLNYYLNRHIPVLRWLK